MPATGPGEQLAVTDGAGNTVPPSYPAIKRRRGVAADLSAGSLILCRLPINHRLVWKQGALDGEGIAEDAERERRMEREECGKEGGEEGGREREKESGVGGEGVRERTDEKGMARLRRERERRRGRSTTVGMKNGTR